MLNENAKESTAMGNLALLKGSLDKNIKKLINFLHEEIKEFRLKRKESYPEIEDYTEEQYADFEHAVEVGIKNRISEMDEERFTRMGFVFETNDVTERSLFFNAVKYAKMNRYKVLERPLKLKIMTNDFYVSQGRGKEFVKYEKLRATRSEKQSLKLLHEKHDKEK